MPIKSRTPLKFGAVALVKTDGTPLCAGDLPSGTGFTILDFETGMTDVKPAKPKPSKKRST